MAQAVELLPTGEVHGQSTAVKFRMPGMRRTDKDGDCNNRAKTESQGGKSDESSNEDMCVEEV